MISRRDFLKVAGATAFVVATAGMTTGCSDQLNARVKPVYVKAQDWSFGNPETSAYNNNYSFGQTFNAIQKYQKNEDNETYSAVKQSVKLTYKRQDGYVMITVEDPEGVTGTGEFFLEDLRPASADEEYQKTLNSVAYGGSVNATYDAVLVPAVEEIVGEGHAPMGQKATDLVSKKDVICFLDTDPTHNYRLLFVNKHKNAANADAVECFKFFVEKIED